MYGLSEKEFQFLKEKLIQPLKDYHCRVYLFGSRATAKQKKFSDIDILYSVDQNHPLPSYFISNLLIELEDSNFPYKVDLVDDKKLAKSYQPQIENEKIEL
jgi:predicted nucleotidyltransferase